MKKNTQIIYLLPSGTTFNNSEIIRQSHCINRMLQSELYRKTQLPDDSVSRKDDFLPLLPNMHQH